MKNFVFAIFIFTLLLAPQFLFAAEKPNIILIMCDDLGYGDLSPYDGWIKTPHLERMAKEGMLLTDYHSNGAVCSPTRAALMTGRYQQRAGIPGVVKADTKAAVHQHGLQKNEFTFADAMKKLGYTTAMFGKWHLGYYPRYNPSKRGFETYRGFVSGNIDYFSKVDQAGTYDWWEGTELVKEKKQRYLTTLLNEWAIDFIEQNKEKPFFLYVAHGAPHYPYQGPEDKPPYRKVGKGRSADKKNNIPKAYTEMVQEADRGVGQILDKLVDLKLAGKTLVFFCSDNGACKHGNNKPLRASKGSPYEGGHRVPAIAWQPGKVPADVKNHSLVIGMDLMPTAIRLAGGELPSKRKLDGVDISDILYQNKEVKERKLFWGIGNSGAMRDGSWKLVAEGLFNLAEDLGETKNLADQFPERAVTMQKALDAWRKDVAASATPQPAKE